MEKVLKFIDEVPFKDIEVKQLNDRKDRLEAEVEKCGELCNSLYEDFKNGIISKDDYEELHKNFAEKRSKAEAEIKFIDTRIKDVVTENTDKYRWMEYFTEYKDISELTRTVAVELIKQVKVIDKNHIEVIFSFDDSFCSMRLVKVNCMPCQSGWFRRRKKGRWYKWRGSRGDRRSLLPR